MWKIQLTCKLILFLLKMVNDEERLMHSKRIDIEIMTNDETEEEYHIYISI